MIKQILVMPIIHYLAILLLLILYIILDWKKRDLKKNLLFILFCLLLFLGAREVSPSLNSHYLLDAFHSDVVLIKNDESNISVNLDDLFGGKYLVVFKDENIIDEITNLNRSSYMDMFFYKDDKQLLKLKICEAENKDEYTFDINGTSFVLVYNGNIIKFNSIVHENISSQIMALQ